MLLLKLLYLENRCAVFSLMVCFLTGLSLQAAPVSGPLNCSRLEGTDQASCCFTFAYDYNFPQGITSISTNLLNPGVIFSGIDYSLGSGWQYEVLQNQRRLRWTYQMGAEIPAGDQSLFQFCLGGWNPADSVALQVIWRSGNTIAKRDTLMIACTSCWTPAEELVECQPDSSYYYTFNFHNESGFEVDFLTIREPEGQDLIVEQEIVLALPLANGAVREGLALHIRAEAEGQPQLCFEITPRHLLEDDIALECCTAEYCITLPECDRCCTEYVDFESDVSQGFRVEVSCENENVLIQANELNDCDRVVFEIQDIGSGLVDGNEAVIFGGLTDDRWYEVCMTVTRQDRNGENCYEEASLVYCDSFYYDCDFCFEPDQIDLQLMCPPDMDIDANLVCGCDSMTYLNACAAENWAGITLWEIGRCSDPPVDEIILNAVYLVQENQVRLNWSVGGLVTYRYFLVQRRLPGETSWTTIGQVDNMTFEFFDTNPVPPEIHYRIVGVITVGKVVFSNEEIIFLVGLSNPDLADGGRLWPNPVRDELFIALPITQRQLVSTWNAQGQLVYQGLTDAAGETHLATDLWPPGYYFIKADLPDGKLWRAAFVVQ